MTDAIPGQSALNPAVTAAGVDHVRLAYHYLDTGDIDGLGSLLTDRVQISLPDAPPSRNRSEALHLYDSLTRAQTEHRIRRIVADCDSVAAIGQVTQIKDSGVAEIDFADFFTLSAAGMILSCQRFYFAAPVVTGRQ